MFLIDRMQKRQIINLVNVCYITDSGEKIVQFKFYEDVSVNWTFASKEEKERFMDDLRAIIVNGVTRDLSGAYKV